MWNKAQTKIKSETQVFLRNAQWVYRMYYVTVDSWHFSNGSKTIIQVYDCSVHNDSLSHAITVSAEGWHWTAGNIWRTSITQWNDVDGNSVVRSIGSRQRVTASVLFQMITSVEPLTAELTFKTLLTYRRTTSAANKNHTMCNNIVLNLV